MELRFFRDDELRMMNPAGGRACAVDDDGASSLLVYCSSSARAA